MKKFSITITSTSYYVYESEAESVDEAEMEAIGLFDDGELAASTTDMTLYTEELA